MRLCWSAAPWNASFRWRARQAIFKACRSSATPICISRFPPDKVVALCTGSQGEQRAAMARIANDDHPLVKLSRGDTVIFSSRTIPGNEKAVGHIVNGLITQGVEVITDRTHLVHVSGHPRRDELRDMISWVKPQLLIPRAWRTAASVGTCCAGACRGRAECADLPQWRSHQAWARSGRDHRRIAARAALQGRADPRTRDRARSPSAASWRYAGCVFVAIAMTDKGDAGHDLRLNFLACRKRISPAKTSPRTSMMSSWTVRAAAARAKARSRSVAGIHAPRGARLSQRPAGARRRSAWCRS